MSHREDNYSRGAVAVHRYKGVHRFKDRSDSSSRPRTYRDYDDDKPKCRKAHRRTINTDYDLESNSENTPSKNTHNEKRYNSEMDQNNQVIEQELEKKFRRSYDTARRSQKRNDKDHLGNSRRGKSIESDGQKSSERTSYQYDDLRRSKQTKLHDDRGRSKELEDLQAITSKRDKTQVWVTDSSDQQLFFEPKKESPGYARNKRAKEPKDIDASSSRKSVQIDDVERRSNSRSSSQQNIDSGEKSHRISDQPGRREDLHAFNDFQARRVSPQLKKAEAKVDSRKTSQRSDDRQNYVDSTKNSRRESPQHLGDDDAERKFPRGRRPGSPRVSANYDSRSSAERRRRELEDYETRRKSSRDPDDSAERKPRRTSNLEESDKDRRSSRHQYFHQSNSVSRRIEYEERRRRSDFDKAKTSYQQHDSDSKRNRPKELERRSPTRPAEHNDSYRRRSTDRSLSDYFRKRSNSREKNSYRSNVQELEAERTNPRIRVLDSILPDTSKKPTSKKKSDFITKRMKETQQWVESNARTATPEYSHAYHEENRQRDRHNYTRREDYEKEVYIALKRNPRSTDQEELFDKKHDTRRKSREELDVLNTQTQHEYNNEHKVIDIRQLPYLKGGVVRAGSQHDGYELRRR